MQKQKKKKQQPRTLSNECLIYSAFKYTAYINEYV